MNRDELLALPTVVDLMTAGRAWGVSRSQAYELARRGDFPCPVQRIGSRYRVVTEHLLASLGLTGERPTQSPCMRTDDLARSSAATAELLEEARHDQSDTHQPRSA